MSKRPKHYNTWKRRASARKSRKILEAAGDFPSHHSVSERDVAPTDDEMIKSSFPMESVSQVATSDIYESDTAIMHIQQQPFETIAPNPESEMKYPPRVTRIDHTIDYAADYSRVDTMLQQPIDDEDYADAVFLKHLWQTDCSNEHSEYRPLRNSNQCHIIKLWFAANMGWTRNMWNAVMSLLKWCRETDTHFNQADLPSYKLMKQRWLHSGFTLPESPKIDIETATYLPPMPSDTASRQMRCALYLF